MDLSYIGAIASLVGVAIAILFWLTRPSTYSKLLARLFPSLPNYRRVLLLEDKGLIIENKELLSDTSRLRQRPYIFWPVVPTDAPNLIHLIFLRFLKELSESGLQTVVFVFDYYYEMLTKCSPSIRKEVTNQFIDGLLRIGLSHCKHKLVFENEFIYKADKAQAVISMLLSYLGEVTVKNLTDITASKQYDTSLTMAIRYFKPVLNMLYTRSIDIPIGITLSGYDERELWDTFRLNLSDGRTVRLTNLYIPILPSLSGGRTSVLDKIENITIVDTKPDIRKKVGKDLAHFSKSSLIGLALQLLLFNNNKKLHVRLSNASIREYESLDALVSEVGKNDIDITNVIEAISQVLYEAFHGKQKDA